MTIIRIDNTIDSCRISSNASIGIFIRNSSSHNTIAHNDISHNELYGIHLHHYNGQIDNTIMENKIYSNRAGGIEGYVTTDGTQVIGNEIYSNGGNGIVCGWSQWTIEDNSIYSNSGGILLDSCSYSAVLSVFFTLAI